jgi:hypothetical protein
MRTNLENFIEQNKDAFNEYEPSAKLWDKLEVELKETNTTFQQKAVVRKINFYKWVAAASVILLVGLTVLFFTQKNIDPSHTSVATHEGEVPKENKLQNNDTVLKNVPESIYHKQEPFIAKKTMPEKEVVKEAIPVLKETEVDEEMIAFKESKNHFAKLIAFKQNEIKNLSKHDTAIYRSFTKDIDELNSSYKQLNKELPKTQNKSALINAMIYNLQIQIDLLNKQLIILNKIESKQKKQQNEENILSI